MKTKFIDFIEAKELLFTDFDATSLDSFLQTEMPINLRYLVNL